MEKICPYCEEELDYLDTITNRCTLKVVVVLFICHNENCDAYSTIFNVKDGVLSKGDPTGCY